MTPDLRCYDAILCSISGGKDSQTALRLAVRSCRERGIPLSRIVCVFAALGQEADWPQAEEMAASHAAHYGLRFIVTSKLVTDGRGGKRRQGLLERIEIRGDWPSPKIRWCTSDFKRSPVKTVITMLVRETLDRDNPRGRHTPVRVLSVMGHRAEESAERAMMTQVTPCIDVNSRRVVDQWLPILYWTEAQVWHDVQASGVPFHYAYHIVGRLSCMACIYAPRKALVRSARANIDRFGDLAAAEQRMATRKITETVLWMHMWGPVLKAGHLPGPAAWRRLRRTWRTGGWFRKEFSITGVYLEAKELGPIMPSEFLTPGSGAGWTA